MKNFNVISLAVLLSVSFISWQRKAPLHPELFVGKWFISDIKINGQTDPDFVAECDSTTYILHADGGFVFCRVWYMRNPDTTTISGTWEYIEKKNQLLFHWTNPNARKPE